MNNIDEMVEGYLKGYRGPDEKLPECFKDRSTAFKHGWSNGRDDRLGKPSNKADVLRRRADMILGNNLLHKT